MAFATACGAHPVIHSAVPQRAGPSRAQAFENLSLPGAGLPVSSPLVRPRPCGAGLLPAMSRAGPWPASCSGEQPWRVPRLGVAAGGKGRLNFLLCCRCCQASFPIFSLPSLLFFKGCVI